MTIVKKIFCLIVILISVSCSDSKNNTSIIEIIHDKVTITKPLKILVDSEVCFKFSVNDKKYKIIEGYINCKDSPSNFDSEKKTFLKCNELLVIEKDTVTFWATYTKSGEHTFQDIRLILVNLEKRKCFYLDTCFKFMVEQNENKK